MKTIDLRLRHGAAFSHPDTRLVRHVGVPGGALLVEADAVGAAVAELRPPVRPAAVGGEVERGEQARVRLRDGQGRAAR